MSLMYLIRPLMSCSFVGSMRLKAHWNHFVLMTDILLLVTTEWQIWEGHNVLMAIEKWVETQRM